MGEIAGGEFTGKGGLRISWREWVLDAPIRGVVVISHGAGEHSGRYAHVAERLNSAGFAVFALDHRGHGRSAGERMRFASVDPLAEDLRKMIAIAKERFPGLPAYLLAHSTGALIGLHYACDHQEELAGVILTGALASVDQAPPVRYAARAIAKVAPGRGLFTVDPETISRDPEVVRAYQEDPLNYTGSYPAETIVALERTGRTFPGRLPGLRLPLLVMHGEDDKLTPPAGSRLVDELASSEDKTLRVYEGLRHEILNEPERDEILSEIVAWLDERTPVAERT